MRHRHLAPVVLTGLALLTFACGRATAPLSPVTRVAGDADQASIVGAGDEAADPAAVPQSPNNEAPTATITSPVTNHLLVPTFDFRNPLTIHWTATDPDGPGPGVKSYRYRLVRDDDADYIPLLVQPESFLSRDEVLSWARLPGTADQLTITGLVDSHSYQFVIIPFDRRQAFTPVADRGENALFFRAGYVFDPAAPSAETPQQPGTMEDERGH